MIYTVSPLLLAILFAFCLQQSTACVASGVCGGQQQCLPPPPPAVCQPASCQQGYSCGQYGCYRKRARVEAKRTDTYGRRALNVFGVSRSQSKLPIKGSYEKAVNPSALFLQCCEDRKLPDACLQKCNFATFTKETLTDMYFKTDPCPIEASAELQFCAAQGRDHRSCCARNGVTTTLAGSKCLTFCDQREGNITQLDLSYISCYDRFENMKSCFWHDIVQRFK